MAHTQTTDDVALVVDAEFAALLPAHSEDERRAFREAVEGDGCFRDPILYWIHTGRAIIIDGHQRWSLWCSLPDDTVVPPPDVREVSLPDRDAAALWMIRRQLGRRTLSPKARTIFQGRLYNAIKGSQGGPRKQSVTSDPLPISGAEKVAKETKASPSSVKRSAAFVDALDAIGRVNPTAKSDIETGSLKISNRDVVGMAKGGNESISAGLKNIRAGRKWNTAAPSFDPKAIEGKPTDTTKKLIVDINKACGAVSRALAAAAEVHGEGEHYQTIFTALTAIKKACAGWRSGK